MLGLQNGENFSHLTESERCESFPRFHNLSTRQKNILWPRAQKSHEPCGRIRRSSISLRISEGPPKTRTYETPWAFAARAWLKFWKRTKVSAPSSASGLISGPMSDPLRILISQSPENLKIIKKYIFYSKNCFGHFQVHLKSTWKSIMTIWVSSRNCMFYNTNSLLDFSGRPEIGLRVFEKHIFHNETCSGPTWKSTMPIWVSRDCSVTAPWMLYTLA